MNGLGAIAFIPLNLLLIGIPSALVVSATLPLAALFGNADEVNRQFLNVALYLTFLWPLGFVPAYWLGFKVFRQPSKLAQCLIYGGLLYAWAIAVTFALTRYFAQA
jgi:hypothetical protein